MIFRHNLVARANWVFMAVFALYCWGLFAYAVVRTVLAWPEPDASLYGFLALFPLLTGYLFTLLALQGLYVWSTLEVREQLLVQRMRGRETTINLLLPWTSRYTAGIERTSTLHSPWHQWVEVTQDGRVIRFSPWYLRPRVSPELLPPGLDDIWREYAQHTRRARTGTRRFRWM